jgi:hypothetical protein
MPFTVRQRSRVSWYAPLPVAEAAKCWPCAGARPGLRQGRGVGPLNVASEVSHFPLALYSSRRAVGPPCTTLHLQLTPVSLIAPGTTHSSNPYGPSGYQISRIAFPCALHDLHV